MDNLEVTPEMIEVGLAALHEWIDTDDRNHMYDAFAIRDAFVAMYECAHRNHRKTEVDRSTTV